jgi:hypothetical protein
VYEGFIKVKHKGLLSQVCLSLRPKKTIGISISHSCAIISCSLCLSLVLQVEAPIKGLRGR